MTSPNSTPVRSKAHYGQRPERNLDSPPIGEHNTNQHKPIEKKAMKKTAGKRYGTKRPGPNRKADSEYVLLGDARKLTRNGKATATEGGRGHG